MERLLIGPFDDDLAQSGVVERVVGAAARLAVADLESAVGEDAIPDGASLLDLSAVGVGLEAGDEEGPGADDVLPPGKVDIALVEDVGRAWLDGDGAADGDVAPLWRGNGEADRQFGGGVEDEVELEAAQPGVGFGEGEAPVTKRDAGGVDDPDEGPAFAAQARRGLRHQMPAEIGEGRRRALRRGVAEGRASRWPEAEMVERGRVAGERFLDLAQAVEPGELGEQKRLEMALAGPRRAALADMPVAVMLRHDAVHDASIERFQKTAEDAINQGHGGPPEIECGNPIPGPNPGQSLPCTLTHPHNPGQQWAKAGIQ